MASVKRFLTEPELAALNLPALGTTSYYLELGDSAFADEDPGGNVHPPAP